jgi:predicted dehydrogenase
VKALRIAVAGAGLIGRRHVEIVAGSPRCLLAAIVDPAPPAAAIAERAGVPRFASLADLFASQRPDGVIVATPNAMHVGHALECVRHGIATLVEKPVADAVAEGARLAEGAEAAGVPVLVGHHRRHSPILAAARDTVRQGTLGPLVAVMGSALFHKPDDYFADAPWRRQPGGGPILINMIHEVDDLRTICGDIVAVQAFASNATRGFEVEDTVAINLRFAGGALGTFLLSDAAAAARSWEQTSAENKAYPHHPDEDCYLLAGTRGSLAVPTMRLRTYAGEPSWWKPFDSTVVAVARDDPLVLQLDHFCDVIERKAEPRVSVRDALRTLRVTLAIAEAARSGQPLATE